MVQNSEQSTIHDHKDELYSTSDSSESEDDDESGNVETSATIRNKVVTGKHGTDSDSDSDIEDPQHVLFTKTEVSRSHKHKHQPVHNMARISPFSLRGTKTKNTHTLHTKSANHVTRVSPTILLSGKRIHRKKNTEILGNRLVKTVYDNSNDLKHQCNHKNGFLGACLDIGAQRSCIGLRQAKAL